MKRDNLERALEKAAQIMAGTVTCVGYERDLAIALIKLWQEHGQQSARPEALHTPPGVLPRYAAPFKMIGDKTEWVQVRFVPRDAIKDRPTEANPSPIRIIIVGDLERAQPHVLETFPSPLARSQEKT